MNPAARPKVLLLDLGNVTVRLRFDPFFERVADACSPRRSPAELKVLLQEAAFGHADYERGRMSGQDWHAHLCRGLGLSLDYPAWLALWNDTFEPNPFMETVVAALGPQVRVWGLSNTNAEHLRHLRRSFPVLGAFEGITASCEVGARKPEAAIYAAALRSLGVAGSEVLYLDDVEDYVRGAEAQGIRAFHYTFNDDALARRLRTLGFALP